MNVAKFYHQDGGVALVRAHKNGPYCIRRVRELMAKRGYYQRGMEPRRPR